MHTHTRRQPQRQTDIHGTYKNKRDECLLSVSVIVVPARVPDCQADVARLYNVSINRALPKLLASAAANCRNPQHYRHPRKFTMAVSACRVAVAILLLFCLIAVESAGCPEDSVTGDDGECKCVSPCPKQDCQPGQQPVRVREGIPERPGSCCPLYECHDRATVNWLAQEETTHQCVDNMGQPREEGEEWQEADPCVKCVCESGNASCHTAMCRTPCAHPLPRAADECCPRCPIARCPQLVDCDLDCPLGLEDDELGCPVCRCRSVKLLPTGEVDEEEGGEAKEEAEEANNDCPRFECELECEHGLLVDGRGCHICLCRPHPDCPASLDCQRKCPQGYRTNKRGCPSCRCRSSCLDERNVTHPEGTTWRNEPCRSCVCELAGQISCNETVCSVACSDPVPPPPDQCCPICPTSVSDDSRGWGTIPIVLIVVLALLCILLMVHLVRGRFRARLAPSEADFAGFPQQYYKCVPVYETHVPVLRHAEKIAPL